MCTNEEKLDLSTEYANSLNSEEEVSANKHTCSQKQACLHHSAVCLDTSNWSISATHQKGKLQTKRGNDSASRMGSANYRSQMG